MASTLTDAKVLPHRVETEQTRLAPGEPTEPPSYASDDDEDGVDNDAQLAHDREANDQRLQSRFEEIFAKYEQDFSGVGDEIDMETGEIVVNNGHLAHMQHEADPGKSGSLKLVRAFAENLGHEDAVDGESELVGGSDTSDLSDLSASEYTDDEESEADHSSKRDSVEKEHGYNASASPADANEFPLDPLLTQLTSAAELGSQGAITLSRDGEARLGSVPATLRSDTPVLEQSVPEHVAPFNVMDMPAVKESMLALQSRTEADESVNSDSLQTLGLNIANQIAQFIGAGGKAASKRETRQRRDVNPTWAYPELPVDRRGENTAPMQRPRLPQLATAMSPGRKAPRDPQESVWAPLRHPRQQKRKRASLPEQTLGIGPDRRASRDSPSLPESEETGAYIKDDLQGTADDAPILKSCYNCGICATTTWRRGPDGNLCNACGMYLYRYGLMRPPRPRTPEREDADNHGANSYYAGNASRGQKGQTRHVRFSVEEDALIIKLKELDRLTWQKIGVHFEGRSGYAVQCRYAKRLVGQPSDGRDALIAQGFSFDREKGETREGGFTEQDDEVLVQMREESQFEWATIAESLPGQTVQSVEERYDLLLGNYSEDPELQHVSKRKRTSDPDAPKRHSFPFSREEDDLLMKLREVNKLPWEALAKEIPGRTGFALQKRYVRELQKRKDVVARGGDDPYQHVFTAEPTVFRSIAEGKERRRLKANFTQHSSLTLAEEELLMRLKDEEYLSWEDIADRLPGRTILALENRYLTIQARREALAVAAPRPITLPDDDAEEAEGPPAEQSQHFVPSFRRGRYTQTEDRLIVRLREERSFNWEQIALSLPGRTVASVESRWKKLKQIEAAQQQADAADVAVAVVEDSTISMPGEKGRVIDPHLDHAPLSFHPDTLAGAQTALSPSGEGVGDEEVAGQNPSYSSLKAEDASAADHLHPSLPKLPLARPGSKYSQAEHDILVELRDQGMPCAEIATWLPGRTAGSIQHYHQLHIAPRKDPPPSSSPARGTTARGSSGKALLRRALQNGARRRSGGGKLVGDDASPLASGVDMRVPSTPQRQTRTKSHRLARKREGMKPLMPVLSSPKLGVAETTHDNTPMSPDEKLVITPDAQNEVLPLQRVATLYRLFDHVEDAAGSDSELSNIESDDERFHPSPDQKPQKALRNGGSSEDELGM